MYGREYYLALPVVPTIHDKDSQKFECTGAELKGNPYDQAKVSRLNHTRVVFTTNDNATCGSY